MPRVRRWIGEDRRWLSARRGNEVRSGRSAWSKLLAPRARLPRTAGRPVRDTSEDVILLHIGVTLLDSVTYNGTRVHFSIWRYANKFIDAQVSYWDFYRDYHGAIVTVTKDSLTAPGG